MITSFSVGTAFPANDKNAALMQLWIACRHALALQRALLAKPGPAEVEHEQFLHTFLAISATRKEAADAFRTADRAGCFSSIPLDLVAQLAVAREDCDDKNDSSLYKRILLRLRHTAGAHFDPKLIRRGLATLAQESLPLRVGGLNFFDSTFPLATILTEKVLEAQGLAPENALREFPNVINLGDALQKITDATVTIAAQQSNRTLQE